MRLATVRVDGGSSPSRRAMPNDAEPRAASRSERTRPYHRPVATNRSGDDDLAERLRTAIGVFVRATRSRADALPPARHDALAHLDRTGPCTIADLAIARGVRHQGMSRIVAELEEAGLVSRETNPRDARGWVIALTDSGRAALTTDREARRDVLAEYISDRLTDDERAVLARVPELLSKLVG